MPAKKGKPAKTIASETIRLIEAGEENQPRDLEKAPQDQEPQAAVQTVAETLAKRLKSGKMGGLDSSSPNKVVWSPKRKGGSK